MNNYFENALKNYIESLPNEKEAYYMDTNTVNFKTLIDFLFTDKFRHSTVFRVLKNLLRRALLQNRAVFHKHHFARRFPGESHFMRHDYHSGAAVRQ